MATAEITLVVGILPSALPAALGSLRQKVYSQIAADTKLRHHPASERMVEHLERRMGWGGGKGPTVLRLTLHERISATKTSPVKCFAI